MARIRTLAVCGAVLPAVLAAVVVSRSTAIPAWPFLLVGLAAGGGVAAVLGRVGDGRSNGRHRYDVDDGFVTGELVRMIPVAAEGMNVRLTLPLAAKTHGLTRFLCSLPASTRVELCISGYWPVYLRGQNWRDGLVQLEEGMRRHYRQFTIRATRWQSAMMTLEEISDDGSGISAYIQPMEVTGKEWLFVDITRAPTIRERCRRMTDLILERSEDFRVAEVVAEAERAHADKDC